MNRTKLADRELPNYTKGEEIANMVTHILGAVLRNSCYSNLCYHSSYSSKCIWNCKWSNFWIFDDFIICNV